MRRYLLVLREPHVSALIGATLLARFPIGINALAIVLYLRAERGSFAVAGAVAGALAAGSGIGAPVQGRLVDAFGQRRVLVPLGVVHAAALGALIAFAEAGAATGVLVVCGLLAGFAIPPTSSVLRSMWPTLLREQPELVQAAYALDSALIELIFILGPLLTAAIATVLTPQAALAVSAASVMAGTVAFTALPPSRAMRPVRDRPRAGLLGALGSPGVRTLVITSLPAGVAIGICEVALPAFSDASGAAATAGLLLAIWSLGSATGALVYGALPNRPPLDRVHLAVTALLPVSLLPMAAAPSVPAMAVIVIPAGMFIAPLLATRNELVGWVAPEGARTEAYTWPLTAFVGGIAVGSALAGAIVETASWRTAFLVAGATAALGTAVAVARRATLDRGAILSESRSRRRTSGL
jgi:MFS family permease